MMNTMKFANMDEYLDKASLEVIISKITWGKSFHPAHIDLLKKEIDGNLKLSKHFRDYMAFASVYGEVQQELINNEEVNKIRDKKILRNAIILVQGHCFIDEGERFGDKDPSTETERHESSNSHPMKCTGFGVEDFHCQDRGIKTNIFTWISSTFKIDIDPVEGLLINVEMIEHETNEQFKILENAFGDLKITLTEVKYQNTTQRTNVYTPLFHISDGKQFPYGTKLPLGSTF
jgi:hypothetical protein